MKIIKFMNAPCYSVFTLALFLAWITFPRYEFIFAPLTILSYLVTSSEN